VARDAGRHARLQPMRDPVARLNDALSGRYRVESLLGEGGMAVVYLAHDLRHGRPVALKVLKPELAAVVGADRFLAEIKTTANLQHPHILPLFDSGHADGMLFYVMPYVDGESLRGRLDRERQLPVDEALRIATNLAEALDYAHRQGVIHRDIKPANILLRDGMPVIADFGIALAVTAGGAGRLTETGLSLGTPHYMSPEQATGDVHVGPATDIYAVGCVLFEMLVGEPPYTGGTPQAILGKVIAGEDVSATKHRSTVPPHVDAAIRKAIERVPADRFATAEAMTRALADRGFRHGESMTSTASARRSARRSVALVCAGALAGVAAVALWPGADSAPASPEVMRFVLATPGGDSLSSGTLNQDVAISRDGRLIAYTGSAASGASPQIYLRSLDRLESTPVAGAVGHNPFFSPDGAWIGFVDAADPRTVKRVPTQGGTPETVATLPSNVPYIAGATWGADGRLIVGTGATSGLFRSSPGGGVVENLTQGQHHWPSLIEGRDAVLIMDHANGSMRLAVLDLRTSEVKPLGLEGTSPRYVPTGDLVYTTADGAVWAAPFDVKLLQVVGSPVRRLTGVDIKVVPEGAANFSVSDNGRVVYGAYAPRSRVITNLVSVARDGSRSILTRLDGRAMYPRFSPDGARIAFGLIADNTNSRDLWVFDVARGALTRVTFGGSNWVVPVWSPDGRSLTYADGTGADNRVLTTTADGSGVSDTLLPLAARRFPTSWSPDGRTLAYYAGGEAGTNSSPRDVWLLRRDGDRQATEPFVVTPFSEAGAIFSPDGRWLAFVSDKSGRNEVYVRPIDGSGWEVTISVGGGSEPVWAPSRDRMYYRHDGDLMTVSIEDAGSRLNVGTPQRVLEDPYRRDDQGAAGSLANYDAMPGGGGFVMVEDSAPEDSLVPASARLRLVLNWFEELRARTPN